MTVCRGVVTKANNNTNADVRFCEKICAEDYNVSIRPAYDVKTHYTVYNVHDVRTKTGEFVYTIIFIPHIGQHETVPVGHDTDAFVRFFPLRDANNK